MQSTIARPVDDTLIEDVLGAVRAMLGMDVAYVADTRFGLLDFEWLSGDAASFGVSGGDAVPLAGTYCELMLDGRLDGLVPDARNDPRVAHLPVTESAGVGAYLGVPLVLPDGTVHGTLCCVHHGANPRLGEVELRLLQVLARLIGEELLRAQDGWEARDLAVGLDDDEVDRLVFEDAPIGSVTVDLDGSILRANRALCAIVGRTGEDLAGRRYLDLVHPDDRASSASTVEALIDGSEVTVRADRRMLHRSGRVVETRVTVSALHDGAHDVERIHAHVEDVTEVRCAVRELQHAQAEMLARLAAAAEFRDDDTGQHTRRVGALSAAIAERLSMSPQDVELIRAASPLHDVGKIAIPDGVLTKPGPLTGDEFDLVKTHTTAGWQMLDGSSSALVQLAAEIARTHHERWDGSGYPVGLTGPEIPLSGRIVAVADVFDALTHTRPYKAAWSVSDALDEMADQSGRHFDPAVLSAFLELQRTPAGARR
jgi:PAS domain S-box-containing protein